MTTETTETFDVSDGVLIELNGTGDSRFMWSRSTPAEVDAARAQFDSLRAKGYLAYTVRGDGGKGEVIREFDPSLERIIMTPPLAGG